MAFARHLDAMQAQWVPSADHAQQRADDLIADVVQDIGELLGGLSVHGFEADLKAAAEATSGGFLAREWMAEVWWIEARTILETAQADAAEILAAARPAA